MDTAGSERGGLTYFRSCKRSLALSMVMREVGAAGMMMMGVLEPKCLKIGVNQAVKAIMTKSKNTRLFPHASQLTKH